MTTILDTRRFRKGRSGREMPEEDLLVFGYACKLFRDDEKAQEAEQMLIPWNGDDDLLISRYDVRAQLTDESEFAMEGPFEREEKDEIERLCDEERERDLRDAEASDEEERQETEGRSYAGYRAVGFDYEEVKRDERAIQRPHDEEDDEEDDEMEPYEVPHGFLIPDHIQLPPSMKVHSIIEKTAKFVSGQGAQMEIMIKAKQASNPQFDFLSFGSPLNAYYKHLMQSIKNGTYTPVQPKDNDAENSSHKSSEDDDDDDDEYSLHPSLFAKRKSPHNDDDPDVGISTKKAPMLSALAPVTLKLSESRQSPKFSDTKSSGVLKPMSSYSSDPSKPPYFVSQERRVPPASAAYFQRPPADVPQSTPLLTTPSLAPWHSTDTSVTGDDFAGQDLNVMSSIRPPPPSDVQAVIDKLAQYVVRNGGSFESVVARKGDSRFAFLNSTHVYNGYYEWKKQELKRQMKVKSAKPEHIVQSANVKVAAPKPADAKKIEVIRVTAVRPSVVARSGAETAKEKEEEEEEEEEEVIEPIKEIIVKEGGYCIDGGDKEFQEERIRQERKRKAALFAAKLKEDQAKKDRNGKRDRRSRSRERSRSTSSSSSSPRKSRRRRRSSNSSPDRDRHRHRHHRHHHRRHRHHHHHKKQKHRRRDKEADKDK